MRNIAIGEFFLNIGKAILLLAFAKLLYDETGQIWAFTVAYVGSLVLSFIIPFIAGGFVDHKGSRNVLRYSAALNVAVCIVAVTVVDYVGVSVPMLLVMSVALSAIAPIIKLSIFTVTPELSQVEDLEKHNGSLTFAFQAGQLVGMGMAAWLLKFHTLKTIFITVLIVNVAALVFYFLATTRLTGSGRGGAVERRSLKALGKLAKMSLPYLPVFLFSNFDFAAIGVFNVLLAAVVFHHYDNDPVWLSGLDASFAVGAVIAGMLIAKRWKKSGTSIRDPFMTQCYFFACVVLFLIPGLRYAAPLAVAMFGLSQSYSGIFWLTKLQKEFPVEFKGRLAGSRALVTSIYTGLITFAVSFSHQVSFEFAIGVTLAITTVQAMFVFAYRNRYRDERLRRTELKTG